MRGCVRSRVLLKEVNDYTVRVTCVRTACVLCDVFQAVNKESALKSEEEKLISDEQKGLADGSLTADQLRERAGV